MGSRPGQHSSDLVEKGLLHPGGLHDVRLLAEVLGDHHAGRVESLGTAVSHRTNNQLRSVEVVDTAAGPGRADLEVVHGLAVVLRRDQVVEYHPVGNLAGQLHHLHAGGSDVDGHVLGPALLVDVVQLHPVEVHEVTVEGDRLVGQ